MPEALAWVASPHRHFPKPSIRANAGLALGVLLMTAGRTSAKSIRELSGTRFITHKSWRAQSTPKATEQGNGERERERVWTCGSAFIWVKGGMSRVSWVHFLLANLIHKSRN